MFELDILTHGDATELVLRGDLDTASSMDLDARIEALVPTLAGDMIVDLTGLTYLNSTGIRSFIRLDKALKAHGRSFKLSGVSARIFRIFSYCGLNTYFTIERQAEQPAAAGPEMVKVVRAEAVSPLPTGKES